MGHLAHTVRLFVMVILSIMFAQFFKNAYLFLDYTVILSILLILHLTIFEIIVYSDFLITVALCVHCET